jgi:hypothetical protein
MDGLLLFFPHYKIYHPKSLPVFISPFSATIRHGLPSSSTRDPSGCSRTMRFCSKSSLGWGLMVPRTHHPIWMKGGDFGLSLPCNSNLLMGNIMLLDEPVWYTLLRGAKLRVVSLELNRGAPFSDKPVRSSWFKTWEKKPLHVHHAIIGMELHSLSFSILFPWPNVSTCVNPSPVGFQKNHLGPRTCDSKASKSFGLSRSLRPAWARAIAIYGFSEGTGTSSNWEKDRKGWLKNISQWEGLSHILWKKYNSCLKPPTRSHLSKPTKNWRISSKSSTSCWVSPPLAA